MKSTPIHRCFQINIGKVSGIVGAYNSDYSQVISFVCRKYNVPQLSYGSTAVTFDDKVPC
jgi:hypothetical protein